MGHNRSVESTRVHHGFKQFLRTLTARSDPAPQSSPPGFVSNPAMHWSLPQGSNSIAVSTMRRHPERWADPKVRPLIRVCSSWVSGITTGPPIQRWFTQRFKQFLNGWLRSARERACERNGRASTSLARSALGHHQSYETQEVHQAMQTVLQGVAAPAQR